MRILVIDDNPDHRELVIGRVKKTFPDAEFEEIIRQSMLDEALEREDLDFVLTDYRLQWSDGLNVLQQVRRKHPETPVVMVTDTGSEEIAAAGMKAGLADYVLKGHLHRLPLVARESLEKARLKQEHERALEQLRISEERYRTVSELCSDYAYCYRVDADGSVALEWLTQAFTRITGYTSVDLEEAVLLPVVHPSDRSRIEQGREQLLLGRPYQAEFRIVTKNKEVRWLRDSAQPVWDAAHTRVCRIYGAGQDITDRKHADEERAERIREQVELAEAQSSEKRYRSLAEAIPQIVWTARPDGQVDYFNRRWFEFTGLSEHETYGRVAGHSVLHPEDAASMQERWQRSLRTGEVFEIEYRFRGAEGTYRWFLGRAVPLRDTTGAIVKWFGTCTDIDDQKRTSEAMREAQKLESIGILAGGVAHDFNNLLTGILGNASLVLDELPESSHLRPMLQNVMLASERAADLTRQLLAYSGKGRFFVQSTSLSGLVREISSLIQSSIPKKVELRLELGNGLPDVDVDPAQIQQLVMNLVINGAEAIGEDRSGVVSVSTRLRHLDEAAIARTSFVLDHIEPGAYVAIQVRDNGCGMDESVRPHIFDPFFTTKFTGRGLGLAAALGIVRGHKGAIRMETSPGKGTTFEILLPAGSAAQPKPERAEQKRDLRGAGAVLVIDDEELVRDMARVTLERYGYSVLLAANGEEGVEMFRDRRRDITLVLLDMMMPVMSGAEAMEELRKISADVPVIASSGYSESMAKERFGERGMAAFLQKPYSAKALADCVKKVVEQRATNAAR
ncbi:MAG TPA: response regulator [Candidatus Limnocylindrales bacterium]|nr:response regulator [Candidatus Limnocylindrales bacterium]